MSSGQRTAEEVLDDHLQESWGGTIEDDLVRNYSPAVVVLTRHGVYRGHEGMRQVNCSGRAHRHPRQRPVP
jgi:hypothetical protein